MRLTRAGEYGVRCILYLSSKGVGVLCNRMQIAEALDFPGQFLGRIAQQLARAGYIEIFQGAKGGLKLVVSPEKLTLLDAESRGLRRHRRQGRTSGFRLVEHQFIN